MQKRDTAIIPELIVIPASRRFASVWWAVRSLECSPGIPALKIDVSALFRHTISDRCRILVDQSERISKVKAVVRGLKFERVQGRPTSRCA